MREPIKRPLAATLIPGGSACPTCGAPAMPSGAPFLFASTSGAVLHQTWRCANGCSWFSYVLSPEGPSEAGPRS